jgi:hypothetical protein
MMTQPQMQLPATSYGMGVPTQYGDQYPTAQQYPAAPQFGGYGAGYGGGYAGAAGGGGYNGGSAGAYGTNLYSGYGGANAGQASAAAYPTYAQTQGALSATQASFVASPGDHPWGSPMPGSQPYAQNQQMPYKTMPELAGQGYGYAQPQAQQNPYAYSQGTRSSPTYTPQNDSLPGTYVYDNNQTFANMNQGLPPTGVAAQYADPDTALWDKNAQPKGKTRGVKPKSNGKFLGCC